MGNPNHAELSNNSARTKTTAVRFAHRPQLDMSTPTTYYLLP